MIKEETFMGEVVQTTSPLISENEATFNAGFGKYDYDPGARAMMMDQFMNPPTSGIGMPPYGLENPLLQQTQYQTPQAEQVKSFIKPCNFNGEYLPIPGWEDKINQKILYYMDKYDEQSAQQQYGNYYGTSNYYGTPYFSPFNSFNPITNEISNFVESMKNEAKDNRIEFNKLLSRTAHKFSKEDITEEEIDDRYRGKYVNIPGYVGMTNIDISHQSMLARQQPVSNAEMYRQHSKQISDQYHSIIPENSGMLETFAKTGLLKAEYDLEEEKHRRNNVSNMYNSNDGTYRSFVKAKAAARYKDKINSNQQVNSIPNTFQTLQECAKEMDDGTLSISIPCNFGSHQGELYTVSNSQEKEYEESRQRFTQFYNSIPGAFGLQDPNPNNVGIT